ncbi:MAG: bifunctional folylpolyglutamate synthase/dihydrofolate synthase [Deltaproteobacteria bacterium]|nr:bifunctional folylpolyglutamate synthase/dihydrofolate synthase [Deltaproteobacteria bacterium]
MLSAGDEYNEVLASLYSLEAAKGMDFKLERVELALKNLGEPQRQFAAVHIAGTNGKGSVAAMLHAMLSAAGEKVGIYTSPHLVRFTERIRVGEREIEPYEVVRLFHEVHEAATARGIELTFFEFTTVMAFVHFARTKISIAVVETGLGGRLDATNVIEPEVAVITTIGFDHQEYLGNTLESIAFEKAGIIKAGKPVVVGPMPAQATAVIAEMAKARSSVVLCAGKEFSLSENETEAVFRCAGIERDGLKIGLRGQHQRDNAAVALAVAHLLAPQFGISADAMRTGLATVRWPGRLEVIDARPLIVLDGAHNADGISALCRELPHLVGARPIHLVFSVMRDKAWPPMVERLAAVADTVTLTTVLPQRAEVAERLVPAFACHCPVEVVDDPRSALDQARQRAGQSGAVVVTGSLFLVGALYPYCEQIGARESAGALRDGALHP